MEKKQGVVMEKDYKFLLKIIIFFVMIFIVDIQAQDAPTGYTEHFGYRKWAENANPSADSLNQNMEDIDLDMYNGIINTDSLQFIILNKVLIFSPYASGMAAFTGTDQYDTIRVPGIDSLDVVNVSIRESIPTTNDLLGVFLKADTLIVKRPASGTPGLKWNWSWIKKYQ